MVEVLCCFVVVTLYFCVIVCFCGCSVLYLLFSYFQNRYLLSLLLLLLFLDSFVVPLDAICLVRCFFCSTPFFIGWFFFFFFFFDCREIGLVGSSNTPISGITLAAVIVSGGILILILGEDSERGPPTAIMIGSVVCVGKGFCNPNTPASLSITFVTLCCS